MKPIISVIEKGVSKYSYISYTHYYRKPEDRSSLDWSAGLVWDLKNFEVHRFTGPHGTSK